MLSARNFTLKVYSILEIRYYLKGVLWCLWNFRFYRVSRRVNESDWSRINGSLPLHDRLISRVKRRWSSRTSFASWPRCYSQSRLWLILLISIIVATVVFIRICFPIDHTWPSQGSLRKWSCLARCRVVRLIKFASCKMIPICRLSSDGT